MPVEDHPVHPMTKKIGRRPGCWNRPPFKASYLVKDGYLMKLSYLPEGVMSFKEIPHVTSTECHSDYQECVGCKHFQGEISGRYT